MWRLAFGLEPNCLVCAHPVVVAIPLSRERAHPSTRLFPIVNSTILVLSNNWLKRSSHPPCRLATTSAEGLVLVQTNSQANTQHSLLFLIDDAAERSVFFPDLHSSFIPMTPVVERVRATSDSVRSGSRKAPFRASASRRPLQPLLIFLVISLRLLTGRPRQMSRR